MPHRIHLEGWMVEGDDRPRILVEASEWHEREALMTLLSGAGYAAAACPGPSGSDERCLLAAGSCEAAEQADLIVHTLPSSDLRNREVLASLRKRLPGTPVIVEVPEPTYEQDPDAFEGFIVVHPPLRRDALLELVNSALS